MDRNLRALNTRRLQTVAALCTAATLTLTLAGCSNSGAPVITNPSPLTSNGKHRTIIFVWDGMRPDSIDPVVTPTLYGLVKSGSYFSDNHSTYPTYTMANAGAFATGNTIGTTGFNGNNTYAGPSTGLIPPPERARPAPPSTSTSRNLQKTGASSTISTPITR